MKHVSYARRHSISNSSIMRLSYHSGLVSTKLTSLANTTHETTQGLLVLNTYQLVYVVHLSNNMVFSKLSKWVGGSSFGSVSQNGYHSNQRRENK